MLISKEIQYEAAIAWEDSLQDLKGGINPPVGLEFQSVMTAKVTVKLTRLFPQEMKNIHVDVYWVRVGGWKMDLRLVQVTAII